MAYYDTTGIQGSSYSLTFKVKGCGGGIINLSGYNISGQVKEYCSSTSGIACFTSSILTPESGICNITLSPAQTSALAIQTYLYNVKIFNSGNTDVFEGIAGHFFLFPQSLN